MNTQVEKAKEIALGDDFGDAVIKINGVEIKINADGTFTTDDKLAPVDKTAPVLKDKPKMILTDLNENPVTVDFNFVAAKLPYPFRKNLSVDSLAEEALDVGARLVPRYNDEYFIKRGRIFGMTLFHIDYPDYPGKPPKETGTELHSIGPFLRVAQSPNEIDDAIQNGNTDLYRMGVIKLQAHEDLARECWRNTIKNRL